MSASLGQSMVMSQQVMKKRSQKSSAGHFYDSIISGAGFHAGGRVMDVGEKGVVKSGKWLMHKVWQNKGAIAKEVAEDTGKLGVAAVKAEL